VFYILKKIRLFRNKSVIGIIDNILRYIMFRIDKISIDTEKGDNNETLQELYGIYFHVEKMRDGFK
jgi:Asp/Glu/hydantoin racemase